MEANLLKYNEKMLNYLKLNSETLGDFELKVIQYLNSNKESILSNLSAIMSLINKLNQAKIFKRISNIEAFLKSKHKNVSYDTNDTSKTNDEKILTSSSKKYKEFREEDEGDITPRHSFRNNKQKGQDTSQDKRLTTHKMMSRSSADLKKEKIPISQKPSSNPGTQLNVSPLSKRIQQANSMDNANQTPYQNNITIQPKNNSLRPVDSEQQITSLFNKVNTNSLLKSELKQNNNLPISLTQTGQEYIQGIGDNEWGQCNLDLLSSLSCKIVQVSAGYNHTLILSKDMQVFAFGQNNHGQASIPSQCQGNTIQVSAGMQHSCLLSQEHVVTSVGLDDFGQCQVPVECQGRIKQVEAGQNHTLFLLKDSSIKAIGCNIFRQAQVPRHFESKVTTVSTSFFHSLALTASGQVQTFGDDKFGQCKIPELAQGKVVVAVAGSQHSALLTSERNLICVGMNAQGQCDVPVQFQGKVVGVSCGEQHTLAVLDDGRLISFGSNKLGQCQLNTYISGRVSNFSAGGSHSIVIINKE